MRLLAALICCSAFAGCSLGSGAGKAGGPPPSPAASRTAVVRFAGADPESCRRRSPASFARVSGGRLRAQVVRYDENAADVDLRIGRDVMGGRIDVASVAARAWDSLGATGFAAFQSPFLLTSDALLDQATADPRVARPLLDSLALMHVTGLALAPIGVRFLFAREPLDGPAAFAGATVRINASRTTDDILRSLGARPSTTPPSGPPIVEAVHAGRLDAIEADMRNATGHGYVSAVPHVNSPLFAKVNALVANSARLEALGPGAAVDPRGGGASSRRAAGGDDRMSWAAACGGGLKPRPATPQQLDALHVALLEVHSALDGNAAAALAIDRIGALAVRTRAADPWMQCGRRAQERSPTAEIDGAYEFSVTATSAAEVGLEPGNDGGYRVEFGHGRYAVFHAGPADPEWPGWDFARDPVEIGSVLVRGDVATLRPETSIVKGSVVKRYRFERFRDRLRWHHGTGDALMTVTPWRRVD